MHLVKKKHTKMMRYLQIIIIGLVLCSCDKKEKGIEYWADESNQNGSLDGFMATPDYCLLLKKNNMEWEMLQVLYDSLVRGMNSLRDEKKDSLNEIAIELNEIAISSVSNLNRFMHDMVAEVGGYCATEFIDLPILPYRKVDMNKFWNGYTNQKLFYSIIDSYNSAVYSLSPKFQKVLYLKAENDVVDFKNMSNIQALLKVIEIELEILRFNLKAKKIITEIKEESNEAISV